MTNWVRALLDVKLVSTSIEERHLSIAEALSLFGRRFLLRNFHLGENWEENVFRNPPPNTYARLRKDQGTLPQKVKPNRQSTDVLI